MKARIVALGLTAALAALPALARAEGRIAVLVGESRYTSVGALDSPSNDVSDMASALSTAGYTEVIAKRDLTLADMQGLLKEIAAKVKSTDDVVFYYAGHDRAQPGATWLAPVDYSPPPGAPDQVSPQGLLPLSAVIEAVKGARSAYVIVDASGDLGGETPPPNVAVALAACKGTLAMSARLPDERSAEHGIYSYVLAEQLRSGHDDGAALLRAVERRVSAMSDEGASPCHKGGAQVAGLKAPFIALDGPESFASAEPPAPSKSAAKSSSAVIMEKLKAENITSAQLKAAFQDLQAAGRLVESDAAEACRAYARLYDDPQKNAALRIVLPAKVAELETDPQLKRDYPALIAQYDGKGLYGYSCVTWFAQVFKSRIQQDEPAAQRALAQARAALARLPAAPAKAGEDPSTAPR